jgi:hypothetical protein
MLEINVRAKKRQEERRDDNKISFTYRAMDLTEDNLLNIMYEWDELDRRIAEVQKKMKKVG